VNLTISVRSKFITVAEHCTTTARRRRRRNINTKKFSLVFYNLMELGDKV
jgi:Leu/Phe-tRNA-protein transferase